MRKTNKAAAVTEAPAEQMFVMRAADVHNIADSLRSESENLVSNQPGAEGRVAAYKRIGEIADRLLGQCSAFPELAAVLPDGPHPPAASEGSSESSDSSDSGESDDSQESDDEKSE